MPRQCNAQLEYTADYDYYVTKAWGYLASALVSNLAVFMRHRDGEGAMLEIMRGLTSQIGLDAACDILQKAGEKHMTPAELQKTMVSRSGLFVLRGMESECLPAVVDLAHDHLLSAIEKARTYDKPGVLKDRCDEMAACLKLTANERNAIEFYWLVERRIGALAAFPEEALTSRANFAGALIHFLGIDQNEARRVVSRQGKLARLGLLATKETSGPAVVDLSTALSSYLAGEGPDSFLAFLFETDTPEARSIGLTSEESAMRETLSHVLSAPGARATNILFHGAAGAGKTSFAVSLPRSLGFRVFRVRGADEDEYGSSNRWTKARCAVEWARELADVAVVIDEADTLLASASILSRGTEKAWLNEFLEGHRAKVFWIANSIDGVEESTLRRFAYSKRFELPGRTDKLAIWSTILSRHPNIAAGISTDALKRLVTTHDASPGAFATVAEHAASINGLVDTPAFIDTMLASHAERTGRTKVQAALATEAERALRLAPHVAAKPDFRETSTALRGFLDRLDQPGKLPFTNFNLLFAGPPGTGKTEFAKALALEVGCRLVVKTASDILSSYVGGTERRIADMFEEAERNGHILFIDEADALFWSRDAADRSWEVSRVNELLAQMESFRGVLVCATNNDKQFDEAALRRFAMVCRFSHLAKSGIEAFAKEYLSPLGVDAADLLGDELPAEIVPSDFKVVLQRLSWGARDIIHKSRQAARMLSEARDARTGAKARPVGFGRG